MQQLQTQRLPECRGAGRELLQEITSLEKQLALFVEAPCCVVVRDSARGMRLALQAAGVKAGDKVLCPAYGQQETVRNILALGAVPAYVDVNPNTLTLDPYCLDYVVGRCIRTKTAVPKALVTVDLFGLPCNYRAIEETCQRHGIVLVEDMTQALGARAYGKRTGSFGRFAVASLQGSRLPGCLEEDGAVFCHNQEDEQALRKLGAGPHLWYMEQRPQAMEVQLTLLGQQLGEFWREYERRQKVAARYRRQLAGHVKLPLLLEGYESACTHFPVLLPGSAVLAQVLQQLAAQRIPCSPAPLGPGRDEGELTAMVNARRVAQRLLLLPMHSYLTNHVVDYICSVVTETVDKAADSPA